MRAQMVDTAGEILGKVMKRGPDWFQDSENHITGQEQRILEVVSQR